MHLSTAQLCLSSQKWVYQDFSAVGVGRRPRRGEKAREGGGEGRSTNSFILCFLPSPSASFILGFAGPLTPPPLCYRTEAMLTAGDPGPSLLGGLSALPAWFSPFAAPKWTPTERSLPSWALQPAGSAPETLPLPAQRGAAKSKIRDKGF